MGAPPVPRRPSYRDDTTTPWNPEDAPLPPASSTYAELRNDEPVGVAERIGAMLDAGSDSPMLNFLGSTVKGVAGAPITRLLAKVAGRGGPASEEFDDFLATVSAKSNTKAGSAQGRLLGTYIPEVLAYSAVAGAASSLGAHGVRIGARTAAVQKYFEALSDPRLAGLAKPVIVRAGEILGNAVGTGALAGAESAATGGEDPLKTALKVGLLTGGIEAGFTVGAKAISRGAREIDKHAIAKAWESAPARGYLQTVENDFRKKLLAQSERVGKAIDEELVERQLQGMTPAFVPATATAKIARTFAKAQRSGLAESVGKRVNAIRKLHQASGNLQVARKYAAIGEQEILAGAYLSARPTNFDSTFGSLRAAWRRAGATPDAIRKELGVVGENAIRAVDNAVLLGFARGNSSIEMLWRIKKNIEGILGRGALSREIWFDLEDGGEALVRKNLQAAGYTSHQVNKVVAQMDLVTGGADGLHEIVVKMGGEPAIDTAAMGVARYITQMMRRGSMSDDAFVASMQKHLMKKGFTRDAATRRALDIIEARKARGFQRFGSIDERRLIPGTTREKVASGMVMETDPWKAWSQYYIGMHQRISLSQTLGFKNEMLDKLVEGVRTEAGAGAASLFRSNVEAMAGLKYYNKLAEKFAASVTNLEAASKMGFSFVPNAFQFSLNNPLIYGLRNTFQGIKEMATGAPKDLQTALGFMATDFFDLGLRGNMMSDFSEGVTAKIARAVLRATGFSKTEQFNRATGAFGAHAVMTDILAKASTGRLRGNNLTFARKVFEEAGLDLSAVLRNGITKDQYLTGAMRLMRRTQFSAGEGTRAIRPILWQHPLGRVIFQFGTFTLNQGRLIRDFVFNEIAKGDKKQLARFLAIYMPMAEVSVATQDAVREVVTGRSRERSEAPIVRALEDIIYAGSFGMANTMFWAAKGGRMEKLLGPAVTDFFTYGEALADGRFGEIERRIVSLPSVQFFSALGHVAYIGGQALIDASEKYLDAVEKDDPEGGTGGPATSSTLTLKDFREAEAAKQASTESRRPRRPSYRSGR